MQSTKKNFYSMESYDFKLEDEKSSTVVSLTPFVSPRLSSSYYVGGLRPYYQRSKHPLISTVSPSLSSDIRSINIHKITDDHFDISSSFSNKISEEILIKNESSCLSLDEVWIDILR